MVGLFLRCPDPRRQLHRSCCSGDRHACLPRCVVEGCGGSARIVSGRGIGGGICSSADDRRYCFPHCVGGGGGQGVRFCRWTALTAPPATGGTVPSAASIGGALASSAVAATSVEISAVEPATTIPSPRPHQLGGQSGRARHPLKRYHRTRKRRQHRRPAVLLPLLRRWRGRLESLRQQLGPLVKSAARGGRPPTPLIPVPCFRWSPATTTAAGCSMAVAAAVIAAAAAAAATATTTPATMTHGESNLCWSTAATL